MVAKKTSECRLANPAVEKDLQSVIDGFPFYVMLIDEAHCIVLANKTMQKALGKRPEELIGGYCPTIVHGTAGPFPGCPLEEAASKQISVTHEMYDDRTQRWVLSAIYPTGLKTVAGKKVYYHTAIDITEQKLTGEALNEAEAKFRNFADYSYDWEYWLNHELTEVIYMSPSCERITGYKREEFVSDINLLRRIVYPEDRALFDEHVHSRLEKDSIGQLDFRVLRKDGTLRWIAHSCHEIFDSTGVSLGRRVSNRDITARKELEEQASLRESQLRQIIDLVPHMIYVNDWDGRFILANEATAKAYNTTPEQLLQKKRADVHQSIDELNKIIEEDREVMTEGCAKEIPEAVFTDASGCQKIMRKAKVPFKYLGNEGEQTYAVLGVSVDITDLKHAEKLAAKNLERLTEAFHGMIAALAATVQTRDPYTAMHQSHVRQLATAIAKELEMTENQIESLGMAAMVHDIGKIYLPAEILNKPGRLTDIEFTLIKSHVDAGYEILKDIRFRDPVADIVRQHHERLDGSGYPQGLTTDNILPEAKIMAVADVFEAMSSDRPYRPALGIDAALDEIRKNRSVLYDERVVDACLVLLTEKDFKFS
jgi:PAS domain S-box-containing protein/putative nucleotidyltransferase with HDIG domain